MCLLFYVRNKIKNSSWSKLTAVFPQALPAWFIKFLPRNYDRVLDPFCGSGTTCQVAQSLVRHSVGIEIKQEYDELANANLNNPVNYQLFEEYR